jgi:predicted phosphodiesterase
VKLAHLADLHLGFRQYHRQTPLGLNQREADVALAFRRAIDGVIGAKPDVVVVAGDLFHSVRPTNPAILLAFQQFHRLRAALPDAPIVVIAGNHDTPRSSETGIILKLLESLDVKVVVEEARRLAFPELDLSVLAVPHMALVTGPRPLLRREGPEKRQVLMLHGELEGQFPNDRTSLEYGGATFSRAELLHDPWDYVALGHYHVQHQVIPKGWYSGSLEYVTSNPWGELRDEKDRGLTGKGWLLVDLDSGKVERKPVLLARRVLDLPPIEGAGRTSAELDGLVADAVASGTQGIADQIVRQVVRDVPRHVGREMSHAAIRAWKAEALHFQLDVRRPESHRTVGVGAPGRRQTLPEIVQEYLKDRSLPADLDRDLFVATGTELVNAVEREWAEG